MADPLLKFAANVRRLRTEKGLTQDALAQGASMDPAEVRRIESGRRDPGVRVLSRVAAGLGVKPADLLDGVG
ncbi:MAG TPA: helix-turn-helix transcriptional regulator [Thermoleophilaceae bacterium]|nr:helix-turn-helix transcriptional regulator [Thermoleophilaceae bacterium]